MTIRAELAMLPELRLAIPVPDVADVASLAAALAALIGLLR
jgi:hypothetical protein